MYRFLILHLADGFLQNAVMMRKDGGFKHYLEGLLQLAVIFSVSNDLQLQVGTSSKPKGMNCSFSLKSTKFLALFCFLATLIGVVFGSIACQEVP
jgi:hypothetical protein